MSAPTDALRERAAAAFEATGWPSRRQETWKDTPVKLLAAFGAGSAPAPDAVAIAAARAVLDAAGPEPGTAARVVVVDGHPVAALSAMPGRDADAPEGLAIYTSAEQAAAGVGGRLGEVLGGVVSQAQASVAAINGLHAGPVVTVHVDKRFGRLGAIEIVHVATAAGVGSHPRTVLLLDRHAEATVIERWLGAGAAATWSNAVTEVSLADGATLKHTVLAEEPDDALHVGTIGVRVGRDASYRSCVMSMSGRVARTELTVTLAEAGASCQLDGLYLGADQRVLDHVTTIDHAASDTSSLETYKGIVGGHAKGAFVGRVLIREGARRCETHQLNKNLLLTETAEVQTRPQLEIDNDDVIATHGSTVGQLDAQAVFYLRSRGIPEAQARGLLTSAFAQEIVDRLPTEALVTRLGSLVDRALGGGEDSALRATS